VGTLDEQVDRRMNALEQESTPFTKYSFLRNAARFLERYHDQLCTFNDDVQGTAAVATATLISAINVTGVPLEQQKIVMVGFGSAGIGITNLLAQFMQDRGVS